MAGGALGSLTVYIIASKRCGPTVTSQGPTLVIESLGGLFFSICSRFVFFGLV